MGKLLEILLPWGPVFFGALILAPMSAAVMDQANFPASAGFPSLYLAMPIAVCWGFVAKVRGQWL